MKKQLMYYFYFDTFEFLEVYKLHFACINSYNDIFDQYTFIIGVDDINDKNLIDYWEHIIIDNIKTNKNILFFVEKNSKEYRDGIVCYKYLISKFNEFDGLVFWGHSKRDLSWNKNLIYKWICCIHYFNSLDIDSIENTLVSYNNQYCTHGSLLSTCFGAYNKLEYMGGMYWVYPKKVLELYNNEYELMISYFNTTIFELENNEDIQSIDHINIINLFGENWFYYFMNKHNMHSFQNSFLDLNAYNGKLDVYCSFDPYVSSLDEVKYIYDDNLWSDMNNYYNKIINDIKGAKEKENPD